MALPSGLQLDRSLYQISLAIGSATVKMRGMNNWDPRLTELMDAAVNDPELARRLVAADRSILDLRTGIGETALHYLAVENYGSGVQTLIDLGASVHVTNEFGKSPLDEAAMVGAADAVAVLLRAGAVPSAPDAFDDDLDTAFGD